MGYALFLWLALILRKLISTINPLHWDLSEIIIRNVKCNKTANAENGENLRNY